MFAFVSFFYVGIRKSRLGEGGEVAEIHARKRCKLNGRSKANMFKSRWDEGLIGMCPGDKRKLTIPPEFGYGDRDVGPIKAGSTLSTSASCPASFGDSLSYYRLALIFQPSVVFETELVAIKNVKDEL